MRLKAPPRHSVPRVTLGVSLLLCLVLPLVVPRATAAQEEEPSAAAEQRRRAAADGLAGLAPRYREWVQSVAGLMTQAELEYFVGLEQDFRRDEFMEKFWEPRDPDPRTP